jgi:protein-disulfide isomerase
MKQIAGYLGQQHQHDRKEAFLKELRTKAGVKMLLEPPRIDVEIGDNNPVKGPAGAPVTIVEFSDFQCPYCSRVIPTLKKVEETYGDRIRIAFRDLPLIQMHPNATRAAEAAACAHVQGKFWEMHDKLFANQDKLGAEDLKKHAADLGLDTAAFGQCVESGKYKDEWKKDADAATAYGLSGTPAFFINGRLVVGAQPFDAFAQVIDEELAFAEARAAARPPAAVAKKKSE